MNVLIGTGGWSYFKVPGMDSLEAYSKAFNFVELNSTFYHYPRMETVESWRKKVPKDFTFSVRAHQDLTHKHKLESKEESYKCLDKMINICNALRANILHIQIPQSLKVDDSRVEMISEFLSSANLKNVRIACEIRLDGDKISEKLIKLMQDRNMIHCVDLSKEEPAYKSDVVYTRLFGKGTRNVYQFTDDELKYIDEKAMKMETKEIFYNVHCIKMYKDAARLKIYKQTGRFPKVTKSTGLESLKEVLIEDAKFPSDKRSLIENQGWKVIDFTDEKRIHAMEVLNKLPEKIYTDIGAVIEELTEIKF